MVLSNYRMTVLEIQFTRENSVKASIQIIKLYGQHVREEQTSVKLTTCVITVYCGVQNLIYMGSFFFNGPLL